MTTMTILRDEEFHSKFYVISNNADGNCLFESIETLLNGSPYETEHGYTTAFAIRKLVGEFYREFDKDIDYPDTTIEYKIKIGILFDNVDDISQHDYNICNDRVWASMTDVLICSLLFEFNIDLYKYVSETNTYHIETITAQYNYTKTVSILYNGVDHFEALLSMDHTL